MARGAELLVRARRDVLGLGDMVREALDLAIDADQSGDELVALRRGRPERAAVPPERAASQVIPDDLVFRPLRRLLGEELDPWTDLAEDVDDPDELDLGVLDALQRVLAAHVQAAGARGLLDHDAPVGRPEREHLVDEALADDDERVVREVRAREEILQVAEPDAGAIHEVLGLAVLVQPATDLDLVELDGEPPRRVVELEDRLGHAQPTTGLRAGEDELLVPLRAQDPGVVLAEGPADRIGHVRLPPAIRTDDRGDAWRELEVGPLHEALEAGEGQRLQHGVRARVAALDDLELVGHRAVSRSAVAAFSCASRLERPAPRARRSPTETSTTNSRACSGPLVSVTSYAGSGRP